MRLTTPFTALRNATSDIWKMHDFNYQLPKDQRQENELAEIMKKRNSAGWKLISTSTAIVE